MKTYANRESALACKWAVAKSMGCDARDLVVVRHGDRFRLRTRKSLERWLASRK
jgi:hypothetical protein